MKCPRCKTEMRIYKTIKLDKTTFRTRICKNSRCEYRMRTSEESIEDEKFEAKKSYIARK